MTRARNSANLASHGNLFVDIANDRTGIGSVVPAQNLHVAGTAGFHADTTFTGDLYNATWDRSDNSLKFVDNAKIKVGTGNDLEVYHNGTNSHLKVTNGALVLNADQLYIQSLSENYLTATANGAVSLYHNNVKKFETTAYGTNTTGTAVNDGLVVAGVATVTTMNVTGVLTYDDVTSVDSVGIVTARQGISVPDNQKINVGTGNDLFLEHDGNNSVFRNTTGDFYIQNNGSGTMFIQPVNNVASIRAVANGRVELSFAGNKKFETTAYGIDVTGTTGTDGLAVSGVSTFSGASTFSGDLTVQHSGLAVNMFESTDNHSRLRIRSSDASLAQLEFADQTDADAGEIRYDHANDRMTIHVGDNTERLRITSAGLIRMGNGAGANTEAHITAAIFQNTTGAATILKLGNTNTPSSANNRAIEFCDGTGGTEGSSKYTYARIKAERTGGSNAGRLILSTKPDNSNGPQKAIEITPDGDVLIGNGSVTTQEGDGRLIVYANTRLHPAIKADCIDGGSNRANGFTMLADNYQGDESLTNIGVSYSGGGLVLSRGVKVSNAADNAYLSSVDSFATKPCALKLDSDSKLTFLNTDTSATTTTDSAVSLTERFRITSDGKIGVNYAGTPPSETMMISSTDSTTGLSVSHLSGGNRYGFRLSTIGGANKGLIISPFFNSGYTEALRITSTGIHKITTPGDTADGTYYSTLTINNTGSSTWSRLRFDRSDVAKWGLALGTDDKFRISNLYTDGSVGSPNDNCFVIQNNNNIGINVSSPNFRLHVNGTGRFESDLSINSGSKIYTNNSQGQLTIMGGATYPGGAIKFAGGQSGATDQGTAIFYAGTATSLEERLRLNKDGHMMLRSSSVNYLVLGSNGDSGFGATISNNMNWIRGNSDHLQMNTCTGGFMGFEIGGTERLRIHTDGEVECKGGGAGQNALLVSGNYASNSSVDIQTWQRIGGAVQAKMIYRDATTDMIFGTDTSHKLNLMTGGTARFEIGSGGTMQVLGGNELRFCTSTNNNVRGHIISTETNDEHLIIATSGGEDIAFKDGGISGHRNFIIRGDGNVIVDGGQLRTDAITPKDGLPTSAFGGIIQVKWSANVDNANYSSTSDVTMQTVEITPQRSDCRMLIHVVYPSIRSYTTGNTRNRLNHHIKRDGSEIYSLPEMPQWRGANFDSSGVEINKNVVFTHIDAPSTTNTVTYTATWQSADGHVWNTASAQMTMIVAELTGY